MYNACTKSVQSGKNNVQLAYNLCTIRLCTIKLFMYKGKVKGDIVIEKHAATRAEVAK